jgi:hypothetical protein
MRATVMADEIRSGKRFAPVKVNLTTNSGRSANDHHDELGETSLYPLSPVSLSLYYAEWLSDAELV